MKTVATCLLFVLCLLLCACGNKGSLVLPSPEAIDSGEPAPVSEPVPTAAPDEAMDGDAAAGSDAPLPEPPPVDDDGNG